jgi:hypothetical protein
MDFEQRKLQREQRLRWLIVAIGLSCLVAFGILYLALSIGPAHDRREQTFASMRAEVDQLPPYPGSALSGQLGSNLPFHIPELQFDYTLTGECIDVLNYYATIAPPHGWVSHTYAEQLPTSLRSTYSKPSGDANGDPSFGLIIECFIDQSKSAGYSLFIEALSCDPGGPNCIAMRHQDDAYTNRSLSTMHGSI